MEYFNVRGLPEPIARALERMVQTLRRGVQGAPARMPAHPPAANGSLRLDHRPGKVIGRLMREALYDDVVGIGRTASGD
jgi:hypothetical protein